MNEIAILFSGGTDSTAVVALLAEKYDKIHLISYKRFGIFNIENTRSVITELREKYGDKFNHHIIDFNETFKKLSYGNYLKSLFKFGFMNLSSCGLCKLGMHVETIIFCLKNNIKYVYDGANKNMGSVFPAQMPAVLDEFKKMYHQYGIEYGNPVVDCTIIDDKDLTSAKPIKFTQEELDNSTGNILFKAGLTDSVNIKGSKLDSTRQARCFQLVSLQIHLKKYLLFFKTENEYKEIAKEFMKYKIEYAKEVIIK